MADVWRTEVMWEVSMDSGVVGRSSKRPFSTSAEYMWATSCVKWMVVCGMRVMGVWEIVSAVRENVRYVWSAPMGMGGMVKEVSR